MAGSLYVVAAPSGAGKTTLVRGLLEADPGVGLSVSTTTRAPRPGEVDGRDYRFTDVDAFKAMVERGEFLEWAKVHGNYYGTSKSWIQAELAAGRDVLLEIDWQGARQVRSLFPEAVGIFILPPSLEELERRLRGRGTDSDEVIARRLAAAQAEMRHVGEFDYAIINKELQRASEELLLIVRASRLRYAVQGERHATLIQHLLQ
ncbi:MAG: guanylate kinase [Azonexus sp.]|nr:guanylate kinase [Betaproteobacteria bacterium]MBK8919266.1 guanylate kinase [Betaproteobacteria bacterium]MBP6035196.1 guanylate kinase [Azonexus sp.]MBP6905779.1 guanylate kinase [Azonexus sp.]